MNSVRIAFALLCLTAAQWADAAAANAPSTTGETARFSFGGAVYNVYTIDPNSLALRLYWRDATGHVYGSPRALAAALARQGRTLVFAMNAGMYDTDRRPLGLYVEQGRALVLVNRSHGGGGNFHIPPNGIFYIAQGKARIVETDHYQATSGVRLATQSGPILLEDGAINTAFAPNSVNLNIRNGVCVRPDGGVAFAISRAPVTFYAFARMFRDRLGCRDALYLDGAISRMYLPKWAPDDADGDVAAMFAVSITAKRLPP